MSNPEVTGNTSANESRHPGHGGSVDYSAHLGRANIVVPTTSPSGGISEAPPKYATYIFCKITTNSKIFINKLIIHLFNQNVIHIKMNALIEWCYGESNHPLVFLKLRFYLKVT